MYSLNLVFKEKTKKITLPKSLNSQDLYSLIGQSFKFRQKVIGLTNSRGQLVNIEQLHKNPSQYQKQKLYLIATQDVNNENMSFGKFLSLQTASDHENEPKGEILKKDRQCETNVSKSPEIPQKLQGFYKGVIGDLQLFQDLFLEDNQVTIVFCFVKEKPKNFLYPYYLYHTSKNSAIVYFGSNRVCEFFIESMSQIPKSIESFVQSLMPQKSQQSLSENQKLQKAFAKKSKPDSSKISSKKSQEKMFNGSSQKNHASSHQNNIIFDSDDRIEMNEDQASDEDPIILNQEQDNIESDEGENANEPEEENNAVYSEQQEQVNPSTIEIQTSLLENLLKLRDDGEITELQFYRMKSELLENLSDFMRKYQMGTRKGLRRERQEQLAAEAEKKSRRPNNHRANRQSNHNPNNPHNLNHRKQQIASKQYRQRETEYRQAERTDSRTPQSKGITHSAYSRDQRRSKKYEIPIIVRKYNNVIEKISTSYPLTQEQQQSINLILQLQLKGLISEKQSGIYKTSILQEDPDVFPLFLDYFDSLIDQLELVSRLKKIKKINSEKKERSQHNMRLLIKHAKQNSYELLRTLMLEKNHLVLAALEKFRNDKNSEKLATRLEKIAIVYRQKGQLQEEVFE